MTRKDLVFFFVACGVTVLLLSGYYLMLPVFPLYMQSLSWSAAVSGVLIGIFSASSLLIRPFSGVLSDRLGAQRVIWAAFALYALAALCLLLAPSYGRFALGQLLLGGAIGGFTVALSTYIVRFIPTARMAELFGWHSIAIVLAKGMAPALGLWVYEWSSFSRVLWFAMASVALGMTACLFLPGFLPQRRRPLDSAGGWVLTPAAGRQGGNSRRAGEGIGRADEEGGFTGALGASAEPAAGPGKALSRSDEDEGGEKTEGWLLHTVGPSLSLLGVAFVFGAFNVLIPLYFHQLSLAHASLFFVVETGTVVVFRFFMGMMLPWMSRVQWMLVAFAGVLCALSLLAWTTSFYGLLTVAVVFGFGYAISFPLLNEMVVRHVPHRLRGTAIGLFTTSFDMGLMLGSLSLALLQWWPFAQVFLLMGAVVIASLICFALYLRAAMNRRLSLQED